MVLDIFDFNQKLQGYPIPHLLPEEKRVIDYVLEYLGIESLLSALRCS